MKELDQNQKIKTELSVKQKKQIEHELIGKIIPHEGHTIWQINKETLDVDKAKYSNATYVYGAENKKEIIIKGGFAYVSALNKKNALRQYKKGRNGGKEADESPLKLGI